MSYFDRNPDSRIGVLKTSEGARKAWITRRRNKADGFVHVYHGTVSSVVNSILDEGFTIAKAGTGSDAWAKEYGVAPPGLFDSKRKASVFVAESLDLAKTYGNMLTMETKKRPVVFELAIPKSVYDTFKVDEFADGALRSEKSIPPSWIVSVLVGPPGGSEGKPDSVWKTIASAKKEETSPLFFTVVIDEGQDP